MITLSLDECKEFSVSAIDYDAEESRIRERNENILYDLIEIIKDKKCVTIINNFNKNAINDGILPKIMLDFYEKYVANINKEVKNSTIVGKIKGECNSLEEKIKNFAERWDYEPEYVRSVLFIDDIFLLNFAKDPGKQTFHQHYAAQWLSKLPFIEHFDEPASGGKNALYVVNGAIIVGANKEEQKTGKSIDFTWEYTFKGKALYFYATHKHTKVAGGSQDNQYKDVQQFHEQSKSCMKQNICLLSITDGPYYLTKETSLTEENMTKLEYLNAGIHRGDRNLATTTNRLAQDIIPVIIRWLNKNFTCAEIEEEIKKLNVLKDTCVVK